MVNRRTSNLAEDRKIVYLVSRSILESVGSHLQSCGLLKFEYQGVAHLALVRRRWKACVVAATMPAADKSLANERVVDSGSTKHLARSREWFSSYTLLTGRKIRQGNGFLAVEGVGDIPMRWICRNGSEKRVTLKGVYHVPSLFTNVLSPGLERQNGSFFDGFTNTFRRIYTGLEYGSACTKQGYWLLNYRLNLPEAALAVSRLRYNGPLPLAVQEEHGHGQQHPGDVALPRSDNPFPPVVQEEQESSWLPSDGAAAQIPPKWCHRVVTTTKSDHCLQNRIRRYTIPQHRGLHQQFALPKVYRSQSKSWPEETTRDK
jgi:hypothetical protein